MQFTATVPDESLKALATRVYDLGERPSRDVLRAATTALTDANPVLAKVADVPPGTVVEVPPLEDVTHRPDATHSEDELAAGLLRDHVQAAAALITRQLAADLETELAEAEETIRLARSPELRRLEATGLPEALKQVVAAAQARVAAAKDLSTRRDAVLGQLAADLRDLAGAQRR
jgi:hypothetical protein